MRTRSWVVLLAGALACADPHAEPHSPDAAVPDAAVADAAPPADAAGMTFESCCDARGGCASGNDVDACSAWPPAFGRCSIAGAAGVCIDTAECAAPWSPTPGYCPGPADVQCCRPPADIADGGPLTCTGAERPLPNAGIVPPLLDARCPPGMKAVAGAYCVDAWEAFVNEVLPDGGTADWSPYFNPGSRALVAMSAPGAVPQGYISADQAEAACRNALKRLCTDEEWLRACRGPAAATFPYGNTRETGVCNDHRGVHPAVEYFGSDDPWGQLDHPCLNQLAGGLAPTGRFAGCATAEGLLDMMGNLHEWTADPNGTFRGGFYVDTVVNGSGCLYATTAHVRGYWDYSTGFRCCADLR